MGKGDNLICGIISNFYGSSSLIFVANAVSHSISLKKVTFQAGQTLQGHWTHSPVSFAIVFKFQRDVGVKILTSALCQKNESSIPRSEQTGI